ncbi:hypothetical protein ACJA29_02910 [Metamycoplasma sualvi]|uniref:hypothetical protein n=1 Tax=Metamycoplasma sualvi TaxID=2125 RepID=UPI0038731798
MFKNKQDFIDNVNQNHEYFLNNNNLFKNKWEINFIFHYNSIFTLLCKKIIDSKYFEDFWNNLSQRSFKNKEEYILVFSFAIGFLDEKLYGRIIKLRLIRSENTITHPINIFLNFNFEEYEKEAQSIFQLINEKRYGHKIGKININLIPSIISFSQKINDDSVDFKAAVNQKKENDIKKIIKEIDNKNHYVINHFSKLLIENINEFEFNKNIFDIFELITNKDSKKALIINIIQTFRPIESFRYLNFICENYDKNLIIDNIQLVIDLLFKWKDSQLWPNYYQFDEMRDVLKSSILDHILEVWIKEKSEENNFICFYKWVIFEGNFAGITWYASILEDKLLEKKGFKLMLKEFYINNENIINRINRGSLSEKMNKFFEEIKNGN